jgi:hypothetical protein
MRILEILLLVIPVTAWALWNDRNGDDHKNYNDVSWEFAIMFLSIMPVATIEFLHDRSISLSYLFIFKCNLVSITGFGFLFPYSFNWYWFSKYFYGSFENRLYYTLTHLSKTAWPDRMPLWIKFGWFGRLITYIILFSLAIFWFW